MNAERSDFDRALRTWFEEGPTVLADRVVDSVADRIARQPQRRPWRLRGRPFMNTYMKLAAVLAAVIVVAVVGYNLLPRQPGVGTPTTAPTPTAVPTPTATPTPAATPARVPDEGDMPAGTYFAHPLPTPDDGLTLTFTVPGGWFGFGDGTIFPADESVPGIAFQFVDVTSVNSDLCQWQGPAGDVSAGTTVDDLVAALVAQTAYEVSDPVDVSIAGYSGKRVDVVYPAELFEGTGSSAPDCDEGVVRLWSTSAHGESGIYGQGPDERWQANILDVDGTRMVIVAQDDPGTSADDRAAGDAIVDSMVIEP